MGMLLFPGNGLIAFRLWNVVFLVQIALWDRQDIGEYDGLLYGNLLCLVQELEPTTADRISPFLQERNEILVQHSFDKPSVRPVLLFLYGHVDLSLRERAAVLCGHGLP